MVKKNTDPFVGEQLEEYRIEKLIGKGGMSRVYLARDENLKRSVALKIITLDPDRGKELMRRFEREAETMSKLDRHPNIVRVHRYVNKDENRYLVLEYIEGMTLTQRLADLKREGKFMEYGELIHIMRQVADALDFAHSNKVVHRDIKPSNIMLDEENKRAVLMDFGLVMQATTENNTTLGTAFGTPRYISPEQAISSQQAVPQSDIYSLGVILFEVLVGKAPFDEESAMSLALSHITNPPPDPREMRPDLPEGVSKVLLKALEKTPQDRYATATELVSELAKALGVTRANPISTPVPMVAPTPTPAPATTSNRASGRKEKESTKSTAVPMMPPAPPAPSAEAKATSKEKKSTPSSVVAPKKEKPVTENKNNKMWIYAVGAVIALAVLFGVYTVVGNGDDGGNDNDNDQNENGNSDNNGNGGNNGGSDSNNSGTDLTMIYSNEFLIISNSSGRLLDLTGLELREKEGARKFITRDVGANSLANFEAKRCIWVYIKTNRTGRPNYCKNDVTTRLEYNSETSSENLYWVWIDDGRFTEFDVYQGDTLLKTCKIKDKACNFNLQ